MLCLLYEFVLRHRVGFVESLGNSLLAHRLENFVGSFTDDADVVAASDGMEFNDAGKGFCQFAAHSNRDDVVICSWNMSILGDGERRDSSRSARRLS